MRAPALDRGGMLIVAATALLLWVPRARFGFEVPAPYDEGNTVVAAWRLLEGERLYRDVWQMQPPGTACLLAAAFKLFGATLLVERLLKVLLLTVSGLLLFLLARRVAGVALATAAGLLFLLDSAHYPFLSPSDPAFTLSVATLLIARRALESPPRAALVAGIAAGAAATFRLDFGLYTTSAIGLVLLSRREARRLTAFVSGAALVIGFLAIALRLQGTLADAISDMIVFPATVYPETRGLPIFDIPGFTLPLAILATAVGLSWRRHDPALALLAISGVLFYGYAHVRPDAAHLLPARTLATVAAAAFLDRLRSRPGARVLGLVAIAALLAPGAAHHAPRLWAAIRARGVVEPPATARGFVGFPPDLAEATRYLADHSAEDAPVFVGNSRHDRISLNHVLLYFLAGRRGPTRYYNLHPGLATTPEVQGEIARALETFPAIVLWDAPLWDEPNASGRSSGAFELDAALRERYREVARWGAFTAWEPRPERAR